MINLTVFLSIYHPLYIYPSQSFFFSIHSAHPSSFKSITQINPFIIHLYSFVSILTLSSINTHPWPFSKSKFNLKSDRVNLVAPASPIECLLYLPNVRAIQYKLGLERLTRLGTSNVLWLPEFNACGKVTGSLRYTHRSFV